MQHSFSAKCSTFARKKKKKFYILAIDLTKAFDKVFRPLLWLKALDLLVEKEIGKMNAEDSDFHGDRLLVSQLNDVHKIESPKLRTAKLKELLKTQNSAG